MPVDRYSSRQTSVIDNRGTDRIGSLPPDVGAAADLPATKQATFPAGTHFAKVLHGSVDILAAVQRAALLDDGERLIVSVRSSADEIQIRTSMDLAVAQGKITQQQRRAVSTKLEPQPAAEEPPKAQTLGQQSAAGKLEVPTPDHTVEADAGVDTDVDAAAADIRNNLTDEEPVTQETDHARDETEQDEGDDSDFDEEAATESAETEESRLASREGGDTGAE